MGRDAKGHLTQAHTSGGGVYSEHAIHSVSRMTERLATYMRGPDGYIPRGRYDGRASPTS